MPVCVLAQWCWFGTSFYIFISLLVIPSTYWNEALLTDMGHTPPLRSLEWFGRKNPSLLFSGALPSQRSSHCIFPLVYPIPPPSPYCLFLLLNSLWCVLKKCCYNEYCIFTMSFSEFGSQKDVEFFISSSSPMEIIFIEWACLFVVSKINKMNNIQTW